MILEDMMFEEVTIPIGVENPKRSGGVGGGGGGSPPHDVRRRDDSKRVQGFKKGCGRIVRIDFFLVFFSVLRPGR